MEPQFIDRILTCADCHGEFVFTAGEQLFFYDKQFKNDPKRCKPCKSRRSGLSAAANGTGPAAAGISRTETRTECSECGVQTTVPFKPTQGRPVLCRQCFQLKARAVAAGVPGASTSETVSALTHASLDGQGRVLSAAAAQLAVASMASASSLSSVATQADLASISGLGTGLGTASSASGSPGPGSGIPANLVAVQAEAGAQLMAAELAEGAKA